MSGRAPAEPLAAAVRERLGGAADGGARLRHVEAVVETVRALTAGEGWSPAVRKAAERAAWYHDALKLEAPGSWLERIAAAGEVPDRWAVQHAPKLLHAQAAAVWAAERGEREAGVLAAVRHHPTGRADWDDVGRILFVADFAEPTRPYAEAAGSDAIRAEAARDPAGLARAARHVLGLRLRRQLERGSRIHPDSWRA
ncbi:MAG: hypothetical protein ABR559_00035 [Gemmatimonadota bacterium]